MTRVSLKEAYDNKDVVAQIYAIRDIAEGASDTADSAKTTADDAKTYVDTLGVQVEGAVVNANNASASAQASAQTVSQYDARLTEVEGDLSQAESDIDGLETGLNAVTVRVTTAEGDIVTIQGRVTALETADGQNVKINNINAYAVGLSGNQDVYGEKKFEQISSDRLVRSMYYSVGSSSTAQPWRLIYKMESPPSNTTNTILTFVYSGTRAGSNGGATPAIVSVIGYGSNVQAVGLGASAQTAVKIVKTSDGKIYVFAYAKNVNSGSGSTAYNVLTMRSDTRWAKDTTMTPYDINNGVVTDAGGNVFVSGDEVTVSL